MAQATTRSAGPGRYVPKPIVPRGYQSQPNSTGPSLDEQIDIARRQNELRNLRVGSTPQSVPPSITVPPSVTAIEQYAPPNPASLNPPVVQSTGPTFYEEEAAANRAAEQGARLKLNMETALLDKRAALNNQSFEDRLARLSTINNGPTSAPTAPAYDPAKAQAARDAAFARAKDQAGQTARASLDTLRNVLSTTGHLGGGKEMVATGAVVGGAQDNINDFTREQLLQDLGYATHVDDREFEAQEAAKARKDAYTQSLLGLMNAAGAIY